MQFADLLTKVSYLPPSDVEVLSRGRQRPPRPEPALWREVHRTSAERGRHSRRPAARSGYPGRRHLARHRGGHPPDGLGPGAELRADGGQAGGGRDQAGEDLLPQPGAGAGGKRPQDAGRHGGRRPGGADEAGGPLAQHADRQLPAGEPAPGDGPGDAGHLRAAGPPARHVEHQVGTGRPLVCPAPPRGIPGDRQEDRTQAQRARDLRQ